MLAMGYHAGSDDTVMSMAAINAGGGYHPAELGSEVINLIHYAK